MTKVHKLGLCLVLFSGGLSVWWGCSIGWSLSRGPQDFQALYYGSRSLVEHRNPYSVPDVEQTYRAADLVKQSSTARQYQNMTLYVNTPATLVLLAPLALLPLPVGQVLWMILSVGAFCLAAYFIWKAASTYDAIVAGFLVCFTLLNCQVVFGGGNSAAIVIGLCSIAAWCFIEDKFASLGTICLAISLLIKPHDSGFIWMYFLLAGGMFRKRAVHSAVLAGTVALASVLWISSAVPTWLHDWQSNMAAISGPGGINDPRPAAIDPKSANNVVSLQAVFSVFSGDPRIYNSTSYLVGGLVLLAFAISTMKKPVSTDRAWTALAVVAPLTVLVTYHRVHDTKMLLLTIPACVILWKGRNLVGQISLVLTAAAIVVNADIPLAILSAFINKLNLTVSTSGGQLLTVLFLRPSQQTLLALTLFNLWVYSRFNLVHVESHNAKRSPTDSTIVNVPIAQLTDAIDLRQHAIVDSYPKGAEI